MALSSKRRLRQISIRRTYRSRCFVQSCVRSDTCGPRNAFFPVYGHIVTLCSASIAAFRSRGITDSEHIAESLRRYSTFAQTLSHKCLQKCTTPHARMQRTVLRKAGRADRSARKIAQEGLNAWGKQKETGRMRCGLTGT